MSLTNNSKILYIHGLESGPIGSKTIALKNKFQLYAVDMHMSRYNLLKKNSMIRNIIRQQMLPLMGCIIATGIGFKYYPRLKVAFIGVSTYIGSIYFFKQSILSNALNSSLEQCIDIQKQAIYEYKPDIIIGSSWGGCIAIELMKRNLWNGPTICLCPAYYRIQQFINDKSDTDNELNHIILDKKCLIVHGDDDEIVPLEDSQLLHQSYDNIFDLKVIPGDNHRLIEFTTSGHLCDTVTDYINQINLQ